MSKPIYEMYVVNHNLVATQANKALSEAQSKAIWDQHKAAEQATGVKDLFYCNSAWADEMHPEWGVARYPDLQARIEHTRLHQKAGFLDLVDAFSLLGTSETEPEAVTVPNPIYKLWILKNNPATALTYKNPKGLEALMWEKHNALYKQYGGQHILYCDSTWCNEAYQGFGISAYPDVEANMKIMAGLNELGWPGYFEVISYLGISSM